MLIDVQSADCRADAHQKVVAAAAVALGVTATMNAKLFTSIGAEVDPMLLEKDDIVYVAFDGASYVSPADTVFQPVTYSYDGILDRFM